MDTFGFPPLEVEQATMVIANITDPIDLPWNNPNNLFTRLLPESIRKREERIIKRLKGKGMFGEPPFMLRLQTSRHLLDREMPRFMQSSIPHSLSFVDYADVPRPIPLCEADAYLDGLISSQRTSPQLMGGFIPTRSLTGINLANLDTEIPMPDREETTSVPTEWQIYT